MDLSYSDEEKAFRAEVRAFLEEKLPKEMSDKIRKGEELGKEGQERWHAILNEQGWLAPNWPKKFGGAEWNAVQRHIFEEEAAAAYAPRIVPFGLSMLAPKSRTITGCPASCRAKTGGVRVIPSRVRDRTLRRSRPKRF
jgi:alkylation response protein AidB-like acyl-CoA dehydrogenase